MKPWEVYEGYFTEDQWTTFEIHSNLPEFKKKYPVKPSNLHRQFLPSSTQILPQLTPFFIFCLFLRCAAIGKRFLLSPPHISPAVTKAFQLPPHISPAVTCSLLRARILQGTTVLSGAVPEKCGTTVLSGAVPEKCGTTVLSGAAFLSKEDSYFIRGRR
ncbi:hypothetical protein SOVF_120920, partial [Spinacia oleracea]